MGKHCDQKLVIFSKVHRESVKEQNNFVCNKEPGILIYCTNKMRLFSVVHMQFRSVHSLFDSETEKNTCLYFT
jgi:hypothetical protein